MAAPSQLEVLQKIIDRLLNDAPVAALVSTRIYNHVPQQVIQAPGPFPYLRVRWTDVNEWDTKDSFGFQGSIIIDSWTDQHGDKPILEVQDALHTALHRLPLSLTSGQNVCLQYVRAIYFTEPDGVAHHGVSTFNCIVSE